MQLRKYPKEAGSIGPGQMFDVAAGATKMPAPQNFDIDQFMKKNPLITDFPPLPSRDLIYASARNNPPGPVYQGGAVGNQPTGGGPVVLQPPFFPTFPGGGVVGGGGRNYPPGATGNSGTKSKGEESGGRKKKKTPNQPTGAVTSDSDGYGSSSPTQGQSPSGPAATARGHIPRGTSGQASPSPTPSKKYKKKPRAN
jgi:hypothetical protein